MLVLSDQHSYDMLGAYGNDQVITPNLDQFAKEGIRFNNAISNQPVCTPFRGIIMSGMHPLKNGAFVNDTPLLPNKSKLLGQILKENGYQTAYIGKWHLLGGDRDRPIPKDEMRYGFDTLLTNNCHVDFRPGKAFFWNDNDEKEYFKEWEVYGQTQQALNYLDRMNPDRPFALIVSWHPPHDWGKQLGEDGQLHYRYDTIEELMTMYDHDSILLRPGLEPTVDRRRMYHGHMAMISGVDIAFGMLMEKLKEIGAEANTLTVFTSDHGDMLESFDAELPKQYPHDYSLRVPLLMKFPPKIKPDSETDFLIGALDYMPTILGLLNIKTESDFDGADRSLAILNNEKNPKDHIPIWNYQRNAPGNRNWRGVVTKDFTFAMDNEQEFNPLVEVLFDRKNDPGQLNNLYTKPEYKRIKDSLATLTYEWMRQYNDAFLNYEDFKRIEPENGWSYNYDKNPYGLLNE
ncbi:sulfatase-like hydrolase/transferase [Ulvibacterium sp.]|uniref:sulfatase-like hydrolase/transferase n=1 Tax=Ulvibacterium sp. TaxID=2665914 RepID=UPI003BA93721